MATAPSTATAKAAAAEHHAQQMYLQAHHEPRFDLAVQPWLPALIDGVVHELGVRDLLLRAHEIDDLAETDHFVRAGLRRLLEVWVLQLISLSSADDDTWEARFVDNTGFPSADVDALLQVEQPHLWLWHPLTPFLQRADLVTALVSVAGRDRPTAELVPHTPNDSSQAWWLKGGEVAGSGLSPASAARYLVARWFYALGGNADKVDTGDGKQNGAHKGSVFGEGASRVTHVWRVGGSLFTTVLTNLLRDDVEAVRATEGARAAWHQGSGEHQTLFLRSAPGMSTLLGPVIDDLVATMVRAPVPVPKERVTRWVDQAREEDPHRIVVVTASSTNPVRMSAVQTRIESLHRVYNAVVTTDGRLRRILDRADLWLIPSDGPVEILLVDKGGTGSSPKVDHTNLLRLEGPLLEPGGDRFARASRYVGVALGFKDNRGVRGRLERALRGAFGRVVVDDRGRLRLEEPARRSAAYATGNALAGREIARWLGTVEDLVLRDDDDVERADVTEELYRLARGTFDAATTPYAASARFAAAIARSRHNNLWPPRPETETRR